MLGAALTGVTGALSAPTVNEQLPVAVSASGTTATSERRATYFSPAICDPEATEPGRPRSLQVWLGSVTVTSSVAGSKLPGRPLASVVRLVSNRPNTNDSPSSAVRVAPR